MKRTAVFTAVKDSTQRDTKFSEVCSGVLKQGSSNELLKMTKRQYI
jgi:hypothetical protein